MEKTFSPSGIFNCSWMRVYLVMVGILASLSVMADKGDKWRVTDQDLTVWDSPNYLQKIGMIHRGYEIEELGMDGDMIKFEYKGQTAYVATYCCERIKANDKTGAQEQIEASTNETFDKTTVETSQGEVQEKESASPDKQPQTEKVSTQKQVDTEENAATDKAQDNEPIGVLGWIVIGGIYTVGLLEGVFTIWIIVQVFKYLFRWEKMRRRWDKRADAPIMPEDRLSAMQNPLKLVSNYSTTKILYGKHAARVQLCWILLSYVMMAYIVALSLALLVYYLMFRIALGFISSSSNGRSSSSSRDNDSDFQQATDVYGNSVNVHRCPNGQMMDDDGNTFCKSGNSMRRDCDGSTFN